MSGSKRNQEDPIVSKQTDTDNPFISFRRALDAQISSIFHSVLPYPSTFRRTVSSNDKNKNELDDAFDEFNKKWDNFMEDARREASQFYGPSGFLSTHDNIENMRREESAKQDIDPWTEYGALGRKPDVKTVEPASKSTSWLGYDGKKRLKSRERLEIDGPAQKDGDFSPRPQRSCHSEWNSWTGLLARLKPRFFQAESGERSSVLNGLRNHGYPAYCIPSENIDDPFENTPVAVAFLLHNPYSPLNISSTTFSGCRSSSQEEAKLGSHHFKEAFEDLMRLHHGRRMVEPSETYASQRNPSGHPMHWITRLIEAGVLGQGWSVWGNGATRHGLWFLNSDAPISINATRHSRLSQMPHIPYQGYVMQKAWFRSNSSNLFRHVEAAVDACNSVSSFAASSAVSEHPQNRAQHYENELCTLQWAAKHLSRAISNTENIYGEDDFMPELVKGKITELHDRCTNISEYLISKSKGLDKMWWYGDNDDELFENGEYLGHSFSGVPFLARSFDRFELLSHQMRQIQKSLETADGANEIRRPVEEIFVDLHRSKKLIEESLSATFSRRVARNPLSEEFSFGQCVDLYRSIVENLNTLKSQFVAEGRWAELSENWEPGQRSDYWFQVVEAIRSDCFPLDPSASIQLNVPHNFKSLYSHPASGESPKKIHIRSPEVPCRGLSFDLLYEYLNQIHFYNDPLTAARGLLSRNNYRSKFFRFYKEGDDSAMWGPVPDNSSYPSLLHYILALYRSEIDTDAQLDMASVNDVLCDELCSLNRDGFLSKNNVLSTVADSVGPSLFLEEDYLEQSNDDSEVVEEDEQPNSDQEPEEAFPPWWLSKGSSDNDEDFERALKRAREAAGDVVMDNLSSAFPAPPLPSEPKDFDWKETQLDQPTNPVISTSSTTTVRTLRDGSVERKSIVKTRYADGKEEVEETVENDLTGKKDDRNMSVSPATPTTEENQAERGKEERKKSWFWK